MHEHVFLLKFLVSVEMQGPSEHYPACHVMARKCFPSYIFLLKWQYFSIFFLDRKQAKTYSTVIKYCDITFLGITYRTVIKYCDITLLGITYSTVIKYRE